MLLLTWLKRYLDPFINGEFFQCRCVCHALNLVVKNGTEVVQLQHLFSKVGDLSLYTYKSARGRQEFVKFVHA